VGQSPTLLELGGAGEVQSNGKVHLCSLAAATHRCRTYQETELRSHAVLHAKADPDANRVFNYDIYRLYDLYR
jgi:hypothetical protein